MLHSAKWIVLLINVFFVLFSGYVVLSTRNSPQTWKPTAALAGFIGFSLLLIAYILAVFIGKKRKKR